MREKIRRSRRTDRLRLEGEDNERKFWIHIGNFESFFQPLGIPWKMDKWPRLALKLRSKDPSYIPRFCSNGVKEKERMPKRETERERERGRTFMFGFRMQLLVVNLGVKFVARQPTRTFYQMR